MKPRAKSIWMLLRSLARKIVDNLNIDVSSPDDNAWCSRPLYSSFCNKTLYLKTEWNSLFFVDVFFVCISLSRKQLGLGKSLSWQTFLICRVLFWLSFVPCKQLGICRLMSWQTSLTCRVLVWLSFVTCKQLDIDRCLDELCVLVSTEKT